jgi:predicted transcriptional regulator of viral defense system
MEGDRADKSGYPSRSADLAELLRAGRLGAFFRPGQAADAGLTRQRLRTLVRRGVVERVGRGLYRVADADPTENYSLAMACARVPNSVVCLLSALGVHRIGTQLPHAVWLAIPHKARTPQLDGLTLRVVRFSGAAWTYGVKATEFEGVPARITSPARTIVDCFRYERLIGPEAAMEALLDGLRRRVVMVGELDRAERVLPSRRLRAALDLRSTGAL